MTSRRDSVTMCPMNWRKSSRSFSNGQCAEVAATGVGILVRDSQMNGAGPVLRFSPADWRAFLVAVKRPQGS